MIGGGNRIGGPKVDAPTLQPQGSSSETPKNTKAAGNKPATPSDGFERGQSSNAARAAGGRSFQTPSGPMGNLERVAKDNPSAAGRMAALATQAKLALSDIEKELAGARQLLEQLSAQKFRDAKSQETASRLRATRERLRALKKRQQIAARKMARLNQVADKLHPDDIAAQIDKHLSHHRKLKSRWGRRHHLLGLGEALHCADDDAPAHLEHVLQTDIRTTQGSTEIGDALAAVSPRRVIAELFARTLDGSERSVSPPPEALRGEYGHSIQSYALIGEIIANSLADDPFER